MCKHKDSFHVLVLCFGFLCRPQPTKDKICTAAAASILMRDLALSLEEEGLQEMKTQLEAAAQGVDQATELLMYALAERRERCGQPGLRLGVGRNLRDF